VRRSAEPGRAADDRRLHAELDVSKPGSVNSPREDVWAPPRRRRGAVRGATESGRGGLPGEIKGHFDENALSAAHELFEDASLSERVDQLPFRPGETVLSVDDSFTDALQSWLETTRCVKKTSSEAQRMET
jgi:hypothetical protein